MKIIPYIAVVLVFADIGVSLWFLQAQQPPSSAGKPIVVLPPTPYPPPPYYPPTYIYTQAPPQYAIGADLIPNGEWKVVCTRYECGATNKVTPKGTNTVTLPGLGGRTIEKWLKLKCPVCSETFSNRFEQVWVPEVPPLPVLIVTNSPVDKHQ